eukprot:25925-Prymnesium_polylepis.1
MARLTYVLGTLRRRRQATHLQSALQLAVFISTTGAHNAYNDRGYPLVRGSNAAPTGAALLPAAGVRRGSGAAEEDHRDSRDFSEVCEQTGITLTRYMCEISRANPGLQDLETLLSSIQTACKTINLLVQRAHITGLVGYAEGGGSINVQGEVRARSRRRST